MMPAVLLQAFPNIHVISCGKKRDKHDPSASLPRIQNGAASRLTSENPRVVKIAGKRTVHIIDGQTNMPKTVLIIDDIVRTCRLSNHHIILNASPLGMHAAGSHLQLF